jgi:hypothetical protein
MLRALLVCLLSVYSVLAQGVLGVLDGKITDEVSGQPIGGCSVTALNQETGAVFRATTWEDGSFSLPLLPPGLYDISVTSEVAYRPALVKALEVPVAGFIHQEFTLSLLIDIWQRGLTRSSVARDRKTVLQFYGPDVDISRSQIIDYASPVHGNLEPSISDVVTAGFIDRLPLAGRDVYELIGLLPGASSDLVTARSTGISVNGQRPSSSSFLLDGRENNNYLITGPFAPLPPEAVAEYRVSTNNFAAEYGRTSGYLANAVTHQGTADWHGLVYGYLENDRLDAYAQQPSSGVETGVRLTGPLFHKRLFHSSFADFTNNRVLANGKSYLLPTWSYIDSLNKSSDAWQVLNGYRPTTSGGPGQTQNVQERPSETDRRVTILERVDWVPDANHHLTAEATVSRDSQPEYLWSPYPAFTSGLHQDAGVGSVNWNQQLGKVNLNLRGALDRDSMGWEPAHPAVPRLRVDSGVTLPGSPASYLLNNAGTSLDTAANFLVSTPRHLLKWGGGFLGRILTGTISTPDGNLEYTFASLDDFAKDTPESVRYSDTRTAAAAGNYSDPDMSRRYRYVQTFLYAQDSFRVSSRFFWHYGIRYDYMGSPVNAGTQKDSLIGLNPGNTLAAKLANANFLPLPSGSQTLYHADTNDVAVRTGFAWNLRANGDTVLRGSYGLFYDRPFDNLWLNLRFNNAVPATSPLGQPNLEYLTTPLTPILPSLPINGDLQRYPLTLYQPGFHTPYVHSFFLGIQHRLLRSVMLESNYAGSLGRKLLTTDSVNRENSVPGCMELSGNTCRTDASFNADIDYRGNQGTSEYHAFVSALRIRHRWGEARISYTYSHAIDNQSDPLTGLLSQNLQSTQPTTVNLNYRPADFTVQFDSSADRGNADFDQRQSLLFFSFFDLPSPSRGRWRPLLSNWSLAEVGGFRSGDPFTIYSNSSASPLLYNRANLVNPQAIHENTGPGYGNRLLNPDSFANAPPDKLGTAGRNAFTGPGFYSVDISLSRALHISRSQESRLLMIRVDAYNFLNHINLSNPLPENLFIDTSSTSQFAVASRGVISSPGGLLGVAPLSESARRLQVMFRLVF